MNKTKWGKQNNRVRENLIKIFGKTETLEFSYDKPTDSINIRIGNMYTSPNLSFDKLLQLSKLFGTTKIDVDDYAHSGCDSCDYGSDYGHEIRISNPTKNYRILGYE